MTRTDAARKLEDLAREVDLLVYRLEVEERRRAAGEHTPRSDHDRLRRELEQVKDQLVDLSRGLDS